MNGWAIAISILTALSAGGFGTWFLIGRQRKKITADTTKVQVDTAVEVVGAGDKRLLDILATQTESIVNPLLAEVERMREDQAVYRQEQEKLQGEVAKLREQIRSITALYRVLLGWARTVVAWAAKHPDLDPPLPPLPAEIIDELHHAG